MAIKTFVDNTSLPASDINNFLNNGGLVYIKELSFTNATAASPANIDNCFSATYDSYRIITRITASSLTSADNLFMKLRVGGTTPAQNLWAYNIVFSSNTGGPTRVYGSLQPQSYIGYAADTTGFNVTDINDPFAANETTTGTFGQGWGSVTALMSNAACILANTTSYDGMSVYTASGTISGTCIVYGYRKA